MFRYLRLFIVASLWLSIPIVANAAASPAPLAAQAKADAAKIAELTRKADEVRYAKDVAEIRADILQSQTSWFEILTSSMIGLFGILITVVVLFVTLRSEKLAVAEAKIAAIASLAAERGEIDAQLNAAIAALAEINTHRETARELTKDLKAGEAPTDPVKIKKISELAEEALRKPLKDRTIEDYRALVIDSGIQEDWHTMERRASAMADLFDAEADDETLAFALLNKAYALSELTKHAEAIKAYDDFLEHFASSDAPALQEQVANALVNKGVALGMLTRHEEAIAACDDVVARFSRSDDPALQDHVATALFSKGVDLHMLTRYEEAIAAYDDVVARYGSSDASALQEQVANALVNKGVALGMLTRHEEAIAAYDDVGTRFGPNDAPVLQEQVATALFNKGVTLGKLTRHEEAIAAYDDVVARVVSSDNPALQERVAKALFNKACILGILDKVSACIETLTLWGEKRGGVDCEAIRNYPDFDKVRDRPSFTAFLAKQGCGEG